MIQIFSNDDLTDLTFKDAVFLVDVELVLVLFEEDCFFIGVFKDEENGKRPLDIIDREFDIELMNFTQVSPRMG